MPQKGFSYQLAGFACGALISLTFLAFWGFLLQHHPHWYVEYFLQSFLSESTAFDICAFHFFLDDFPSSFTSDRSLLGVGALLLELLAEINFVANKNLGGCRYAIFQLRIPLHILQYYLLFGIEEGGRVDHRKTNEENIAMWICKRPQPIILFLPCSVPTSSQSYHKPKFTIFPSTLRVVAKLSNTVGSYPVGNLFSV